MLWQSLCCNFVPFLVLAFDFYHVRGCSAQEPAGITPLPDHAKPMAAVTSCLPLMKAEAVAKLSAGDFAAALDILMAAATKRCDRSENGAVDPEVWQGVGNALYGMGLPGHAQRAFRAAHLLAPRFADHLSNVAACLIDTGRTREAISLLRGPAMAVEAALRTGSAAAAAAAAAANGGWKTLLNLASALAEEGRVEAGAARLAAMLALPPDADAAAALHRHVALANLLYASLSMCAWADPGSRAAPGADGGGDGGWGPRWAWAAWEREARRLCDAQSSGRLDALAPALPVRPPCASPPSLSPRPPPPYNNQRDATMRVGRAAERPATLCRRAPPHRGAHARTPRRAKGHPAPGQPPPRCYNMTGDLLPPPTAISTHILPGPKRANLAASPVPSAARAPRTAARSGVPSPLPLPPRGTCGAAPPPRRHPPGGFPTRRRRRAQVDPYMALSLPLSAAALRALTAHYAARHSPAAAAAAAAAAVAWPRAGGRRLRVGYAGSELGRRHSLMLLLRGVLERHDRRRVRVVCLLLAEGGGGDGGGGGGGALHAARADDGALLAVQAITARPGPSRPGPAQAGPARPKPERARPKMPGWGQNDALAPARPGPARAGWVRLGEQ